MTPNDIDIELLKKICPELRNIGYILEYMGGDQTGIYKEEYGAIARRMIELWGENEKMGDILRDFVSILNAIDGHYQYAKKFNISIYGDQPNTGYKTYSEFIREINNHIVGRINNCFEETPDGET